MKLNWKRAFRSLPNILLTLALVVFVGWRLVPLYQANSAQEGKKAPDFAAETIMGVPYQTQDDLGERRIFVFWATWCAPCKIELSRLQSLIEDGKIEADRILAISSGEDVRLLRKTALKRGYTFPIIADHYGTISAAYAVKVTPTIAYKNEVGELVRVSSGISPLLGIYARRFLSAQSPSK